MIAGRDVGRAWDVFQAGHYGWFYTDGRGVVYGPYSRGIDAHNEMNLAKHPLLKVPLDEEIAECLNPARAWTAAPYCDPC